VDARKEGREGGFLARFKASEARFKASETKKQSPTS